MLKDRETVSEENRKDWDKKGSKGQNYYSKNQVIQTIETPAVNDSIYQLKKNGYEATEPHITKH